MPGLYVRTVCPGRKSCPNCKTKLSGKDWDSREQVWSAGVYVRARWNNAIDRFCHACWVLEFGWTDSGINWSLYDLRSSESVPYWLQLPGQETLTPAQVSLCRELSRFVGPVSIGTNEVLDVTTRPIMFQTDEWTHNPLKDWCDENDVAWSESEEVIHAHCDHPGRGAYQVKTGKTKVWFHLPPAESAVLV